MSIHTDHTIDEFTPSTGTLTVDGKQIINDNVGVGVTPSAWGTGAPWRVVDVQGGSFFSNGTLNAGVGMNFYNNGTNYIYKANGPALEYELAYDGAYRLHIAPSGTAGNAITWTQAMTLDANGNLLVEATNGSYHLIKKSGAEGNGVLSLQDTAGTFATFTGADTTGANASTSGFVINKNTTTSRSINAAGTINASGADYAEYENNNGLIIPKGSVVGFKADGTLTTTYAEALRFGIKSTDPSYVGGDTWGSEAILGKHPEQPIRKRDVTEQRLISPAIPAELATDGTVITPAKEAVYETVIVEAGDTDIEWQAKSDLYTAALADFEARLEAARVLVDRVAYSGKVPVNVLGATVGGYIIAEPAADGSISGACVIDPDFAQYKKAVGRVNRLLPDGRAEVAVIVH